MKSRNVMLVGDKCLISLIQPMLPTGINLISASTHTKQLSVGDMLKLSFWSVVDGQVLTSSHNQLADIVIGVAAETDLASFAEVIEGFKQVRKENSQAAFYLLQITSARRNRSLFFLQNIAEYAQLIETANQLGVQQIMECSLNKPGVSKAIETLVGYDNRSYSLALS